MLRMLYDSSLVPVGGSTMSSHTVRVNTFVKENNNLYIDPISIVFVICETSFGFFRLSFIQEKLFIYLLGVIYAMCLNVALGYLVFLYFAKNGIYYMMLFQILSYCLCAIFVVACHRRLQLYYNKLNRFDIDVGCRPKIPRHSLQNLAQMGLTIIMICILFVVQRQLSVKNVDPYFMLILHIANILEVDFYGHLLNLLVPRLKLINYHIEITLSSLKSKSSSVELMKEFVSSNGSNESPEIGQCHTKKLMDLYHIMVEAYDFLIDAIKWQLLVIIISKFSIILGLLYTFSIKIIKGEQDLAEGTMQLVLSILIMVPLFSPCTFGDKVHHEVKRLRELMACMLYENKLDKSGRSITRALLAFTETRNLSFRLLRMLDIDISLPFKFVGLLITYLIILLQFEKVINPGPAD